MKVCKVCALPGPKNKWESIRMGDAGWFFQKNGDSYCPLHVPIWAKKWRKKNKVYTKPDISLRHTLYSIQESIDSLENLKNSYSTRNSWGRYRRQVISTMIQKIKSWGHQ